MCMCVCMYMRATAAVPPLREIKFHKMWWMPVSAEPAVCVSVCVCVCVFVDCMFVSAFLHVCVHKYIVLCLRMYAYMPEMSMLLPWGLGQVRRGDVKVRDVMSWDGNYSDCAFGSHRPGQRSLNQEDMGRSAEPGSTFPTANNLAKKKHSFRTEKWSLLFKKFIFVSQSYIWLISCPIRQRSKKITYLQKL